MAAPQHDQPWQDGGWDERRGQWDEGWEEVHHHQGHDEDLMYDEWWASQSDLCKACVNEQWVSLEIWPSSGKLWPKCQLCSNWFSDEHLRSKNHIKKLRQHNLEDVSEIYPYRPHWEQQHHPRADRRLPPPPPVAAHAHHRALPAQDHPAALPVAVHGGAHRWAAHQAGVVNITIILSSGHPVRMQVHDGQEIHVAAIQQHVAAIQQQWY